jgi:hypothetical protein
MGRSRCHFRSAAEPERSLRPSSARPDSRQLHHRGRTRRSLDHRSARRARAHSVRESAAAAGRRPRGTPAASDADSARSDAAQQIEYARIADELDRAGFDSEPFGNRTIAVKGAPAGVGPAEIEKLVFEILEIAEGELRKVSLDDLRRAMAASIACRAAIKINMRLDHTKMEWLLNELAATDCPDELPARPSDRAALFHARYPEKLSPDLNRSADARGSETRAIPTRWCRAACASDRKTRRRRRSPTAIRGSCGAAVQRGMRTTCAVIPSTEWMGRSTTESGWSPAPIGNQHHRKLPDFALESAFFRPLPNDRVGLAQAFQAFPSERSPGSIASPRLEPARAPIRPRG